MPNSKNDVVGIYIVYLIMQVIELRFVFWILLHSDHQAQQDLFVSCAFASPLPALGGVAPAMSAPAGPWRGVRDEVWGFAATKFEGSWRRHCDFGGIAVAGTRRLCRGQRRIAVTQFEGSWRRHYDEVCGVDSSFSAFNNLRLWNDVAFGPYGATRIDSDVPCAPSSVAPALYTKTGLPSVIVG